MHRPLLRPVLFKPCTIAAGVQAQIVSAYLPRARIEDVHVAGIVSFFQAARALASSLSDGSAPPAFNLRSLARALQYVAHAAPLHGMPRALYDGFSMCFVTMLDAESASKVLALIQSHVLRGSKAPKLPGASEPPAALAKRAARLLYVEVRVSCSACVAVSIRAFACMLSQAWRGAICACRCNRGCGYAGLLAGVWP